MDNKKSNELTPFENAWQVYRQQQFHFITPVPDTLTKAWTLKRRPSGHEISEQPEDFRAKSKRLSQQVTCIRVFAKTVRTPKDPLSTDAFLRESTSVNLKILLSEHAMLACLLWYSLEILEKRHLCTRD